MRKSVLKRAIAMTSATLLLLTGILPGNMGETVLAEELVEPEDIITWDFASDTSGWYYDAGWEYDYGGSATSAASWDAEKQMLKVDVDYSANKESTWSQTAVSTWNDTGMNFAGANQISVDFYYDATKRTSGSFAIKAYSQGAMIETYQSVNEESAVAVDGSLMKASITFPVDEVSEAAVQGLTLALVGVNTDYTGSVWLDNIKISRMVQNTIVDIDQFSFDFSDGTTQGFEYAGWEYNYVTPEGAGVFAENGMLKISGVQFDPQYDWANFAIAHWNNDGLDLMKVSKVVMDLYYPADKSWNGTLKLGIYATDMSGTAVIDAYADVAGAVYDEETGMMKATVEVPFATLTTTLQQVAVKVIGNCCDYSGELYLDNLRVVASVDTADTGVDSTILANAGNPVVMENGTVVTMKVDGTTESVPITTQIKLVDENATAEVKAIYAYLQAIGKTDSVIYGHQCDTWHKAGSGALTESDTKDVAGTISGVVGIDTLSLTGNEYSAERYNSEIAAFDSTVAAIDTTTQCTAKANVQAAAALTNRAIAEGAIITLSAHMPNFSAVAENPNYNSQTDPSYAKYEFIGYTPNNLNGDVMNEILPGGIYHEKYTAFLDMIADYASQVNGPIMFRPFHENTGSWFWWGAAFCNAEQYKNVYRYTVEYLRDTKDVHNIIYVYGPGSEAESVTDYEVRYPGDEYVDLVGFDMYDSDPLTDEDGYAFVENFIRELQIVNQFAAEHGKLLAVTEIGLASSTADSGHNQTVLHETGNNQKNWYNKILNAVSENSDACYMLLWANFSKTDGYYTPYVDSINSDGTLHGHEMLDYFISFCNDNRTIFAKDQQMALAEVDGNLIQAEAVAAGVTGYITAPIAGRRILEPQKLTAHITGQTSEKVTFTLVAEDKNVVLEAEINNGIASADISETNLEKLGECADGKIVLKAGETTLQTISVIFNIEEPEEDPYEIDGFENYYGVDSLLTKKWATNKASGSGITLTLTQDEGSVFDGNYALKLEYRETFDGWAGATISKEVDWSDCNALQLYTIPDGKNQKVVIQVTASDVVYEICLNLYDEYKADLDGTPLLVTIPFSEFGQRDTAGNPKGGLSQDCASISSFGLWVNAIGDSDAIDENGMVAGTIIYDKITAVNTDDANISFEKVLGVDDNNGEEIKDEESGDTDNKGESTEDEESTGSSVDKENSEDKGNSGNSWTSGMDWYAGNIWGDSSLEVEKTESTKKDSKTSNSRNNAKKKIEAEDVEEKEEETEETEEENADISDIEDIIAEIKSDEGESTYESEDGTLMRRFSTNLLQIDSKDGIIPAGSNVVVDEVKTGTVYEKVSAIVSSELPDCSQFRIFEIDICDESDKELHQLSGFVTVTLDVPKGYLSNSDSVITVYRVEEDGTLTKCDTVVEDGKISFVSDHFSTYIIAEEVISSNIGMIIFGTVILLIVCAVCIVGFYMKKNNKWIL